MDKNLYEKIKQLELSHLQPEVRRSSKSLDSLLAEEFKEIGSSGKIIDKAACLSGDLHISEMKMHHFKAQMLSGEVVLTTYFVEDTDRRRNTLRSSIWKWLNGRWQLYFHQGTITELKPEEAAEV